MLASLNDKIKKLTVVDIGLVKFSAFFFAIIIAKLFPAVLILSYPVLIILVLLCGAKPFYSVWFKK